MRGFFIVKLAMDGNLDPKELDLELELEPYRWILEHNMEIQNMYRKCIIHMYRGAKLGGAAGALAPPIILDFTK